jgi:DNA-directed RNA polymerase specialized sigma24 family protein
MSNPTPVAIAGAGDSSGSPLSDEQRTAFWASIVAHQETAHRVALRRVPKASARDVVHSAALRFLASFERARKPALYPATDQDFRRRFLAVVRNHATDCVRQAESEQRPVHSHWSDEPEPVVGGRKIADRELDQVFSRNDKGDYDAPAPVPPRAVDDPSRLGCILTELLAALTPMQAEVITQTFVKGRKRAVVARNLGISVNTYDNHKQAGFRTLRAEAARAAAVNTDVDRSAWYDRIEDLIDLYEEERARRLSMSESDADPSKGDGDASTGSRVA